MKSTRQGAAIYTRVSQDTSGEGLAVERQEEDCRALCAARGLTVVEVYCDNSISAYSGKNRPAFEQLLTDVAEGRYSAVVVYSTDRLYRRLTDLLRIEPALGDVPVFAVKSGDVDLSTADGRLNARMLGSVAQHSSEKSSERIIRQKQAAREKGRYLASRAPFGWQRLPDNSWAPKQGEAELVADAYSDILAGKSLKSVVRRWNASGTVGTQGARFTSQTVRGALLSPRQAGLVGHKGHILTEEDGNPVRAADNLAIVAVEDYLTVKAVLEDPARRTNRGRPTEALLTGTLTCGKCGGRMYALHVTEKGRGRRPVYACRDGQRHLSRDRAALDEPIIELTVARLNAEAKRLAAAAPATVGTPEAADHIAALEERLKGLADAYADGAIDLNAYKLATRRINERIDAARTSKVPEGSSAALAGVAAADDPGATFRRLVDTDIDSARAIVAELFTSIVAVPGVRGRPAGPDDIRYEWAS